MSLVSNAAFRSGRLTAKTGSLVHFHVTGAAHIDGVGNGNPSDHDPDKADYRKAFNGLCALVLQAGESAGPAKVTATSPGLAGASLALIVRSEVLSPNGEARSVRSAI